MLGITKRRAAPAPVAREGADALARLCRAASAKARSLGHKLLPWTAVSVDGAVASQTACKRCGRTLYARVEGALQGFAGRASHERCDH